MEEFKHADDSSDGKLGEPLKKLKHLDDPSDDKPMEKLSKHLDDPSDDKFLEKLWKHLDDSSDEEDSFSDYDSKVTEDFQDLYANINPEISKIVFILENEGRRVMYNEVTIGRYQEKKELLKTDISTESEGKYFSYTGHAQKDIKEISRAMTSEAVWDITKTCLKEISPKFQIPKDLEDKVLDAFKIMSREERTRLLLKQSNSEFLLNQIKVILQSILEDIVVHRVGQEERGFEDLLSPDDFLKIENLKNIAISITTDAAVAKVERKYENIRKERPEWNTTFLENDALKKAQNKNHQISVALKQLKEEIDNHKPEIQLNKDYRPPEDTILSQLIKEAEESGYRSILQKLESTESKKDFLATKIKIDTFSKMGIFLSNSLRSKFALRYPRKILSTVYSNNKERKNIHDFFAEQLLLQRSLTRMSRNTVEGENKTKNFNFVYDPEFDVVSQRSSTVYGRKAVLAGDATNFIMHQGTKLEMITNIEIYGSKIVTKYNREYDLNTEIERIKGRAVLSVLKKQELDDQYIPNILRSLFKFGPYARIPNDCGGLNNEEVLSEEMREAFMAIIDLIFGLEGSRSPSAIVETNMALDLIENEWLIDNKPITLKKIFSESSGLGGGGALSYTMKSAQGAGGIECGRRLSNDVNSYISRKHKYGGEMISRDSKGYCEFLERKAAIAQKWIELQKKDPTNKDLNLKELIRKQDKKWYGIKLSALSV